MKNLFLVAAFGFIANLATAQINYVEDRSTIVYIYDSGNKITGRVPMQSSYETYLGSSAGFLCILSKSGGGQGTIYIYDYRGKITGRISLNGGDTFANISGSTIGLKSGSSSYIKRYDSTGRYLGVN
jgi:hypothetical protein